MRKGLTVVGVFISIALLAILPIACGGGGDGDATPTTAAPTTTTQTLDQDNVDETLRSIEALVPFCAMNAASPTAKTALESVFSLSHDIVDQVAVVHSNRTVIAAVTDESPDPIPGTCPTNPGELLVDLQVDDEENTFSGGIDFDSFCAEIETDESTTDEINIDGGGTFSGAIGLDSSDNLQSATLNFSTSPGGISIETPEGDATLTLQGFDLSINIDPDGTSGEVIISLTSLTVAATDSEGTPSTVTLTGFTLTAEFTETGVTVSSSGTVDEDGVGSITYTATGLVIDSDGNLTAGSIVIDGADGTSVTIIPSTGNDFDISADTDGDGTDDYSPGTLNCDEDLLSGVSLF